MLILVFLFLTSTILQAMNNNDKVLVTLQNNATMNVKKTTIGKLTKVSFVLSQMSEDCPNNNENTLFLPNVSKKVFLLISSNDQVLNELKQLSENKNCEDQEDQKIDFNNYRALRVALSKDAQGLESLADFLDISCLSLVVQQHKTDQEEKRRELELTRQKRREYIKNICRPVLYCPVNCLSSCGTFCKKEVCLSEHEKTASCILSTARPFIFIGSIGAFIWFISYIGIL